jgi:hypothetical protein
MQVLNREIWSNEGTLMQCEMLTFCVMRSKLGSLEYAEKGGEEVCKLLFAR